jgi:hypothetical protein
MDMLEMCGLLRSAERDRVSAAEMCIDELLTIMDRRGYPQDDPAYTTLKILSRGIHLAMRKTEPPTNLQRRMLRIRAGLTEVFPLSDADLEGAH